MDIMTKIVSYQIRQKTFNFNSTLVPPHQIQSCGALHSWETFFSLGFMSQLQVCFNNWDKMCDNLVSVCIGYINASRILQLSCCGLTNYTDWQGTPWGQGHPDKLPYSCCQFTTEAVCSAYKETAAVHRTVIWQKKWSLWLQGYS